MYKKCVLALTLKVQLQEAIESMVEFLLNVSSLAVSARLMVSLQKYPRYQRP